MSLRVLLITSLPPIYHIYPFISVYHPLSWSLLLIVIKKNKLWNWQITKHIMFCYEVSSFTLFSMNTVFIEWISEKMNFCDWILPLCLSSYNTLSGSVSASSCLIVDLVWLSPQLYWAFRHSGKKHLEKYIIYMINKYLFSYMKPKM